MAVVINGTTGITSPSPFVLEGSTSGTVTVEAPAIAGTNTQTLVPATGTLAPLISGTAVSASGTSVDFTDIPSWVKRITVILSEVSTNGSSNPQIHLGTGSTPTYITTGYSSTVANTSGVNSGLVTSGLIFHNVVGASTLISGSVVLFNISANIWVSSGNTITIGNQGRVSAGSIDAAAAVTAVRITTVNGTDTFDAGTINILYE